MIAYIKDDTIFCISKNIIESDQVEGMKYIEYNEEEIPNPEYRK